MLFASVRVGEIFVPSESGLPAFATSEPGLSSGEGILPASVVIGLGLTETFSALISGSSPAAAVVEMSIGEGAVIVLPASCVFGPWILILQGDVSPLRQLPTLGDKSG